MNSIKFSELEEGIIKTTYFQGLVNQLLNIIAQPARYCDLLVKIIIHGPDGCGKRLLARYAAKQLAMNFKEEYVSDLFDENIVGTEKKVKAVLDKMDLSKPSLIYLAGYQFFCQLEEIDIDRIESCISGKLEELEKPQPLILVASTNDFHSIFKTSLSSMFHYDIPIAPANLKEAQIIVNHLNKELSLNFNDIEETFCNSIDKKFYIGNIIDYISERQIQQYQEKEVIYQQMKESQEDNLKSSFDDKIHWDDIGGLESIKNEIIDAFRISIDYPELKATGLKRTGILLYGPPGTGKTLLAKAVATECRFKFISVKGPELLNEYVGQSEDNVRKVFETARESRPAVIFFDELDSLVPNRGKGGNSAGVMDRIVSQVCSEMDGVGKTDDLFVMGATNRVDLVDPSLLRPGRFDKVLEVPLPQTKEDRLQILRALTRKINVNSDVDFELIEAKAAKNLSGADLRKLCSTALQKAFDRCIEQLETGLIKNETEAILELKMVDFNDNHLLFQQSSSYPKSSEYIDPNHQPLS